MNEILGFLLVNSYAFLMILSTTIIFFSKPRLKKIEDTLYKNFLITNLCMSISGLILGVLVSGKAAISQSMLSILLNKVYLICLFLWIFLLTYYVLFVSIKDTKKTIKCKSIFTIVLIISLILISVLPINIIINESSSAIATGIPVIYTYLMFGLGFIVQISCVLVNYKNIKNKKYTPVYILIVLGLTILLIQIMDPNTNYLINPVLIFVAVIMYHTIENPDMKIIKELQKSQEISNNSNIEKSMFLFDVTQSIKQPISKINEISKYIETSKNLEEIKDLTQEIKKESQSIYNTMNSILDVSKVESSKIDVKNNRYNILKLLQEVEKITENNKINDNVKLNFHFSKDTPEELYGDSIRLKQALTIVLNNALKYTEKGSISFTAHSVIKKDVCRILMTIEDTGCGIDNETLNKILSKTKASSKELEIMDEKNRHLVMAKTIISLIGGTLIIDSKVNVGTKITIVLDQKIADTTSTLSKYIDKEKVLLVSDDEKEIEKIKKIFFEYDMNLEVATSGESCLVKIRKKEKYSLILLKEEMEKLKGIDTFKKLKMVENFNTPVIILTQEKEEITLNAYKSLGFIDYIELPVKKKDLYSVINKYTKK